MTLALMSCQKDNSQIEEIEAINEWIVDEPTTEQEEFDVYGETNDNEIKPEPSEDCNWKQAERNCLDTPGGICEFTLVSEKDCEYECACVDDNPTYFTCDEYLEEQKYACLLQSDELGKSCSFKVSETSCEGECVCAESVQCDREKQEKECLNVAEAICTYTAIDGESCDYNCECVSANPPRMNCSDHLELKKTECLQQENKNTQCTFEVSDPSSCKGQCECNAIETRPKRPKKDCCQPKIVVQFN